MTLHEKLPEAVPPFPEFKPYAVHESCEGMVLAENNQCLRQYRFELGLVDDNDDIVFANIIISRQLKGHPEIEAYCEQQAQKAVVRMMLNDWRSMWRYWPALPFPSELFREVQPVSTTGATGEVRMSER